MNKINQFARIAMVAGLYAITGGALHASSTSEEEEIDTSKVVVVVSQDFINLLALDPKMLEPKRAEIVKDAAAKCILTEINAAITTYVNAYVEAASNAGVKIQPGIMRKPLIDSLK